MRLLTATVIALLTGCATVGPDYQEPEVAWLEEWEQDLRGQVSTEQPAVDLAFWWHLFEDPELNALVALGRTENPGLRIAGLRVLEARAVLGIAGSALYPQVQQIQGNATYTDVGGAQSPIPIERSGWRWQAGVAAAWELDFWGRFARGVESADAAFMGALADQQDAQLLVSSTIAELYLAYRTIERRIIIVRENAAIQARSVEITRHLFESGQQSELDVQQAQAQYLGTIAAVPALEQALVQLRNALGVLVGRPPGELAELTPRDVDLPVVDPLTLAGEPVMLLQRRPDVRRALWNVAAQSAQIGIAEADFYPSVALFGSFNWSAGTGGDSNSRNVFAGGPSLQWNILDWGRIENTVRVQDARLQQLVEQYRATVLTAAQEIDDAAIAVLKTREQGDYLDEGLAASRRAMDLALSRYREGYADFQRVLDAQRALVSQTERTLINEGEHLAAIVALYRALGGGWESTDISALVPPGVRATMTERTDWGELLDAPLPAATATPEEISEGEQP